MVVDKPKYRDLKFESKNEFLFWLKQTARYKIVFEEEGQDFIEWYLDERGEVLNSDLQSSIWNGYMVEVGEIKVGHYLPLQASDYITHKVREIVKLDALQKDGE